MEFKFCIKLPKLISLRFGLVVKFGVASTGGSKTNGSMLERLSTLCCVVEGFFGVRLLYFFFIFGVDGELATKLEGVVIWVFVLAKVEKIFS